MQKQSRLKRILYSGLATIACLFPIGCRTVENCVDNSPLTLMAESTTQVLNNPELTDVYKNYFPSNRPELSYKFQTKKTRTRFFINPRLALKDEIDYGITAGFEVRY